MDIDSKNFQIAGVTLGYLDFEKVQSTLGKATVVERGDASSGREQICYVSEGGSNKTYLIFEGSEGEQGTFYLFDSGADWNGSGYCAKSKGVAENLSTISGLRLGITRAQFVAILGEPDDVVGDRLFYSRAVDRKASPEQFERSRREYPEKVSDELAHKMFDFLPVEIEIEGRFNNSKTNYLAVSTTVTH